MANFVLKIFVTMATWVGLSKVWLTPLNRQTLNTLSGASTWVISLMQAHYVLKFANFCYHGNSGRSEQSLTDTLKLADP